MTIEFVLHVRGPKTDFYSVDYFASIQTKPIFREGKLYGYGFKTDRTPAATDLSAVFSDVPDWDVRSEFADDTQYLVAKPLVPPTRVRVSETKLERDSSVCTTWLGQYKSRVPNYFNPHTDTRCNRPEIKGNNVVFTCNRNILKASTTLPIVNGFCCYPTVAEGGVVAADAAEFFSDPSAVSRKTLLIDFSPVGGCSFLKMSDLDPTWDGIVVNQFNPKTQSIIVVVDGRIILPYEYSLLGNCVLLDRSKFSPAMELDRLICKGALVSGSRFVTADGSRDLLNTPNSFFTIVNTPNLQIFEWEPSWKTRDEDLEQGMNTYASSFRNQMDIHARGIMYDKMTRAVHDYSREEHTATFYADQTSGKSAPNVSSWSSSTYTVNRFRPIVIFGGNNNNFMSATGALFTRPTDVAQEDSVLWPDFVLLDFIFRG